MSTSSLESVEEADARMWRDKAFARFKSEAEAVLLHFERAQEWADLIADLLKLQRVLNKYPQFNVVPDKVLVAKRLYQCLNSRCPPASPEDARDVRAHLLADRRRAAGARPRVLLGGSSRSTATPPSR